MDAQPRAQLNPAGGACLLHVFLFVEIANCGDQKRATTEISFRVTGATILLVPWRLDGSVPPLVVLA